MTRGVGDQSPANISKHLGGVDFPCKRDDLVRHAESQGADKDVLDVLRQMPEGEYGSMADVMKGIGKVE